MYGMNIRKGHWTVLVDDKLVCRGSKGQAIYWFWMYSLAVHGQLDGALEWVTMGQKVTRRYNNTVVERS